MTKQPQSIPLPREFKTKREAELALQELAASLDKEGHNWPASAMQGYLAGHYKSLDKAFGLHRKRGRKHAADPKLDAEVLRLLREKTPFAKIERLTKVTRTDSKRLLAALERATAFRPCVVTDTRERQFDRRVIAAMAEMIELTDILPDD